MVIRTSTSGLSGSPAPHLHMNDQLFGHQPSYKPSALDMFIDCFRLAASHIYTYYIRLQTSMEIGRYVSSVCTALQSPCCLCMYVCRLIVWRPYIIQTWGFVHVCTIHGCRVCTRTSYARVHVTRRRNRSWVLSNGCLYRLTLCCYIHAYAT